MKKQSRLEEDNAYAKFEALARKLVNVPKNDLVKSEKKAKGHCSNKERAKS